MNSTGPGGSYSVDGQEHWYAVQTRPRHEKKVASELHRRGITYFVPLVREAHRWSDRRKSVEVPLFPGYAFVRTESSPVAHLAVLCVNGVLRFVGAHNYGTPIPERQIDDVRKVLDSKTPLSAFPFLRTGQKVVIKGGALDGVEGIFLAEQGRNRVVISIEGIQRSLAVTVEGYQVSPI